VSDQQCNFADVNIPSFIKDPICRVHWVVNESCGAVVKHINGIYAYFAQTGLMVDSKFCDLLKVCYFQHNVASQDDGAAINIIYIHPLKTPFVF
jgi:hypothetical protein